jgi:pre-mRNA-processing factor 17
MPGVDCSRAKKKMNSLVNYGSSEEDEKVVKKVKKYDPAPAVHATTFDYLPSAGTAAIPVNLPVARLNAPVLGPKNPYGQEVANKNILTGFIEEHYMAEEAFKDLRESFGRDGHTKDPETGQTIRNRNVKKKELRKRKSAGKADDIDSFAGPWAKFEGESSEEDTVEPLISEPLDKEQKSAPDKLEPIEAVHTKESTKFHGAAERDYLGRTFIHIPTDVNVDLTSEAGSQICYAPKKLVHSFVGHTKGVTTFRLFPQSGHLVLSGSQDTKIKIWDVYHDRKCLRTYQGHDKPIKDLAFSNDGKRFLSAGHDKWIKLWDTETGIFSL